MPNRPPWLRSTAWGGLAALCLTGCAAGGRPLPPDDWSRRASSPLAAVAALESFQPVAAAAPPALSTPPVSPSRPLAAPPAATAAVRPESTPRPRSTTPHAIGTPTREAVVQLTEHREPVPFPPASADPPPFPTPADSRTAADASLAPQPTASPTSAGQSAAPDGSEASSLPQYPISLGTALAVAGGQNPEVGFARWRVEEAYARLNQAEILWLPSIQFGLNYHRHEGNLQNIEGRIVDINRSSLNAGLGAGATAAGTTTVPGLSAQFHLADALFQPKIAERTAWARGHAAQAVVQDRLLDAALAYLELLEAAQAIAIAEEELARTEQLGRLTSEYARTGQGLPSDADRVQTEVALRRNGVLRAEERFAVASARLAEVLSLDGQYQLLPTETTVVPIDLVPLESRRQDLVASGLTQRPELQEARCLVAEACERLKREQYAPLVPSVLLGLSYGGFGGGVGGNVARFHDRADFDALAYWEIRNLGFGERAARRTVESQIEQARFQQVRLMDRVAREIAEAHAQAQYRQRQIAIAQSAVASAQDSYERNMSRIREGQGLPIEVLQSIQALAAARRDYLSSVMDYNTAQFRLQRALGWPVGSSAATVE